MVDTVLLEDRIKTSGKTKSFLAGACSITIQSLRRKMYNVSEFNSSEISTLCDELNISRLSDKEKIFFKK